MIFEGHFLETVTSGWPGKSQCPTNSFSYLLLKVFCYSFMSYIYKAGIMFLFIQIIINDKKYIFIRYYSEILENRRKIRQFSLSCDVTRNTFTFGGKSVKPHLLATVLGLYYRGWNSRLISLRDEIICHELPERKGEGKEKKHGRKEWRGI